MMLRNRVYRAVLREVSELCGEIGNAVDPQVRYFQVRVLTELPDRLGVGLQNTPIERPAPIAAPSSRQRFRSSSGMVLSARISASVWACVQMMIGS